MTPAPSFKRRLLGYLRPYLFPRLAALVAAMLVLSATNGAIPFLARGFINQLSGLKDLATVRRLSAEILGLFLVRAAAHFLSIYLNAYLVQRITLDVRSQLNHALQRLPLSFFNRSPTGAIASRVINDVRVMVLSLSGGASSLVGDGSSLLAVTAAAIYLDWRLALMALIVFPCAVLPITYFSRRMRRMTRSAQKQLGGVVALLHETFQGNRIVKAFGMEDYERVRFNAELERLFRIHLRVARIRAATGPMIETMAAFAVVGVLWYGSSSVVLGTRSAGSFGAFFAAALLVYEPFKRLSRANNNLQQGVAAAERVFEIIDYPTDVPEDPAPIELPRGSHRIELHGVGFRYGKRRVLRDVNLTVGVGEVVALVGSSGAGKSTVADLILRFYDVTDGQILVDGIDVRRLSLASLRSQIGLVTQHTFLFNDTIRANIAYGSAERSEDEIIAAARHAYAHDFIMRLPKGYDTAVGELGTRLSGGERQRIAIARALLRDPPILVLDEATSQLDSESERLVQEALEYLMANRTTVLIAHRLSTVLRADRIAVLARGRITESGSHEELLALGREYRRLYELQSAPPADLQGNGGLAG